MSVPSRTLWSLCFSHQHFPLEPFLTHRWRKISHCCRPFCLFFEATVLPNNCQALRFQIFPILPNYSVWRIQNTSEQKKWTQYNEFLKKKLRKIDKKVFLSNLSWFLTFFSCQRAIYEKRDSGGAFGFLLKKCILFLVKCETRLISLKEFQTCYIGC